MKNNMADLHNHLFAQLERLNDESLKDGDLAVEIKRADAVARVATQIVLNANTVLKAEILRFDGMIEQVPAMLEQKKSLNVAGEK